MRVTVKGGSAGDLKFNSRLAARLIRLGHHAEIQDLKKQVAG